LATSRHNPKQLRDGFETFSHQSGLLEDSYPDLQGTVEALTLQLRLAQSARLQELVKKEKMDRRIAALLEALPGGILVLDEQGMVRQQNSKGSEMMGQPLIGCSWASIVSREIADGGSEDGNIQLRDGRRLSLSRRPLSFESGEVLLLSDITVIRKISEFRQRNERLTTIGKMTAEFAHQVRTPLASAMLYAGQLDTSSESQARIAGKILTGLNDLKRMVNDILGFAAGARIDQEQINVRQLLDEVAESIDGQLSSETTIRVSVTDTDLSVAANKDAIKGALLNLVTNADQASDNGANILLHGHCFGENVHLCVTDDGPGVPVEIQARLFDPFFTTRPQGTGLGLSVVKAVVAAHHGEVTVNSSPLGTSFTIGLPVKNEVAVR